jgi:hypothetical protein
VRRAVVAVESLLRLRDSDLMKSSDGLIGWIIWIQMMVVGAATSYSTHYG